MTGPGPLTCKELVEIVTAYVDGALPPIDRVRFEAHLEGCSGCRRYVQQMMTTIRLTGTLAEDMLPAETQAALLRLFRGWKEAGAGK